MKKINYSPLHSVGLKKIGILFCSLVLGCQLIPPASAQTAASTEQQIPAAAPLDLDPQNVVNEMSKERPAVDVKPGVLSSPHDEFEQSIFNSEHHKKIAGVVEAGAGVGHTPARQGRRSDNFSCEYTGVAINDEISRNAQLGISAQVDACKTR
ncbi:hypothetical protein AAKU67_002399 [Oxalobacteraceae bacterium GrIS 2.11]